MRHAWTLLGLLSVLSLALAACGGGATSAPSAAPPRAAGAAAAAPGGPAADAPPAATQPPPEPVAVQGGMLASILSAPMFAGADLGIYRQNGLDLSIEAFNATSDVMTLVASGRLQFGQVTMGAAALNAYNRGLDIVTTAAGSVGVLHVLVRKDLWDSGAIRSPRDLKGVRFALNGRGTIIEYSMAKVLEKGGLTAADVEVPVLPWPDQIPALGNGAIDIGFVGEPLGALALNRGVAVIMEEKEPGQADPWYAPNLMGGLIMMNRQWAEANPAAARGVIKSYLQTARRIQGTKIYDEPEVLVSVEKWVNVKPEVVKTGTPPLWFVNGRVDVDMLMDVQRFFIEAGGADYRDPMPIERLYNDRYLNAVLQEIGTVPEN
jgi:NitT/TauT family transport system substrate-binding protein